MHCRTMTVNLITKPATKWLDTLDKGMIHIPCRLELDHKRFHDATQNNVQFKTYKFFSSGIFKLIF